MNELELAGTDDLVNELLGRFEHAIFAGLNVIEWSEDRGTQQINRKWKGNSITCQGLAWTLANAVDDDREGRSANLPPSDG